MEEISSSTRAARSRPGCSAGKLRTEWLDGTTIAFIQPDPDTTGTNLWVWPISKDRAPELLVSGLHSPPTVRWAPDGRHVLYWQQDPDADGDIPDHQRPGLTYRVAAEGGEPELLDLSLSRQQLGELTFRPGGPRVVLREGPGGGRHEIWLLSGFPWDERD